VKPYWENDPDAFKWAEVIAVGKRIIIFLGLVYVLLAVGAHYWSLSMIFQRPPLRYELSADYVQMETPDGVKIVGRHWLCPGAKYTLLYLHGNFEDLGRVGEYVPQFLAQGYSVFAIDYRNYGHSEGKPTEQNTYADVQLAYEYLRNKLGLSADHIIIFGYSLGSGPAGRTRLASAGGGLGAAGRFRQHLSHDDRNPTVSWGRI